MKELRVARPFTPFQITTGAGTVYQIDEAGFLALSRSDDFVAFEHQSGRLVKILVKDIAAIEAVDRPAA